MILSELTNIPPNIMEEYRKEAVRNVRRTRGKINLDSLISRNNQELAEENLLKKIDIDDTIIGDSDADDYDFTEDNAWQNSEE